MKHYNEDLKSRAHDITCAALSKFNAIERRIDEDARTLKWGRYPEMLADLKNDIAQKRTKAIQQFHSLNALIEAKEKETQR